MTPIPACRTCVGLGVLISAVAHALVAFWVLNMEPSSKAPGPEPLRVLDLAMFDTRDADQEASPKPSLSDSSVPPALDHAPTTPPQAQAVADPPPKPDPVSLAHPLAKKKATERDPPPPVRSPKAKPTPKPYVKPDKKPQPSRGSTTIARQVPAQLPPGAKMGASAHNNPSALVKRIDPSLDRARAESNYLAELRQAILRNQRYPEQARRRGAEGLALLTFVIQADGQIDQVRLTHSSGDQALDQAAISALATLGRFKPIPPAIGRATWPLRVPIRFNLD